MRADPTTVPHYRWFLLLGLMFCGWAINWYSLSMGILLPRISDDLGLRPAQEGWLGSAFFLGGFVATIPMSWFASRIAPAKLMTVTFTLAAALIFLSSRIESYLALVGIRLLVSILYTATNPARALITSAWFEPSEFAAANGAANSTFGIMQSTALWATGPLVALFGGWQEMYVFFAVLAAISAGVWTVGARDHEVARSARSVATARPATSPFAVARRPQVWYAGTIAFGAGLIWASFVTFWPTYAQDALGFSEGQAGFVFGFASIGVVPASLLSPVLLRRVGRRVPVIIGAALVQLPAYGLMLVIEPLPALVFIAIIQGCTWLYFPILLTSAYHLPRITPREIAVATGFIVVINSAGVTTGPALVGLLSEFIPLRAALSVVLAGPLLAIIGAILLGEVHHEEPTSQAVPAPQPAGS